MKITLSKRKGVDINRGMIGLFFEDINYAADGGLYAEMIENRSFQFLKARGDFNDYYLTPAGDYGWRLTGGEGEFEIVTSSPLSEALPYYARVTSFDPYTGLSNKAYEGLTLEKGEDYNILFFCRTLKFEGKFILRAVKDGHIVAETVVQTDEFKEEKYNFWKLFYTSFKAMSSVTGARFEILTDRASTVEYAYISVIPANAVMGIFRPDLFKLLKELHPGFMRFPGGCIVEGNTLANRYDFKASLKPTWERKPNWNRWAVHGNNKQNKYTSDYARYNQTMGMGFYEYFLLCEAIGAKPLPVLNVGFACQYQSKELVKIGSPEFEGFVQDALDLIEFANGPEDSKWGSVRVSMGHREPFGLEFLGIGNEQWQDIDHDFFERYLIFEERIHERYPGIKLIGSAGPDITSERYTAAWDFYRKHQDKENFAFALDEHYYVKPEWLFEHNEFYDGYDRKIKVFSGEYAAHPKSGFNMPDANTLWGALSEAAFMTGVERNADVVVLASYAPLFARIGYAQWSPDMIWFDSKIAYGSPSYHVQKLFANNMGDYTVSVPELKDLRDKGVYVSLSYDTESGELILKAVNSTDSEVSLEPELVSSAVSGQEGSVSALAGDYKAFVLSGDERDAYNSVEAPDRVAVHETSGNLSSGLKLNAYSFAVYRVK